MKSLSFLPLVNATLNATAAVLLVIGHRYIKRGDKLAHRRTMIGVFTVSTLFLISYLTYHTFHGSQHFQGQGLIRTVYFVVLFSHTILAAAIVPLAIITLLRGLREQFDRHRRIARWAYPIWLYVSITGVLIYLLLYVLFPSQESAPSLQVLVSSMK